MIKNKIAISVLSRKKRNTTIQINIVLPFKTELSHHEKTYLMNELRRGVQVALLLQFGNQVLEITRAVEEEVTESDLFHPGTLVAGTLK